MPTNKYNVKATRTQLDNSVREKLWNKFHAKLQDLESHPDLLQAVVLSKSKLNTGSLLHAVLRHGGHPKILPSIVLMAKAVPQALFLEDALLRTPLYLAIDRCQDIGVVEILLEVATTKAEEKSAKTDPARPQRTSAVTNNARNCNTLTMVAGEGDTPLLKACRLDFNQYLKPLLRYDQPFKSAVLVESKRKRRAALWYVASNELQNVTKSKHYLLPEDLRLMLMATYFALQRKSGQEVDMVEWSMFRSEVHNTLNDDDIMQSLAYIALLLKALTTCCPLLGKYAVKLMDRMLGSDNYHRFMIAENLDKDGNYLMHIVCASETTNSHEIATAMVSTNALLFEQLIRQPNIDVALLHSNREGDMPLHLAVSTQKGYVRDIALMSPAALRHRNFRGELPLHIALKAGPCGSTALSCKEYLNIIDRLWKSDPGTLEVRDDASGLYPFQLAASSLCDALLHKAAVGGTEKSEQQEDVGAQASERPDEQWLALIFTWILAAPQLLKK